MATNGSLKDTAATRRELLRATVLGGLAAPTLSAALAATPAAAMSRLAQQPKPRSGGTVTLVTPQDFPGLDPTASTLYNSDNLLTLLWNGLTRYDENMDVQPDLAERWEAVDPKTFVFHLRQGVRFHNGREAVAADVKFSIERVLDPATKSPYRGDLASIASIDLVDDHTVKVNLSKPNVTLPAIIQLAKIMPPEAAAKVVTHPIGTGPFRFVEFVPGDHITLDRFDGYWDQPKPYPKRFMIQIVKDPVAAYNAFKAGQFDIIWQLDFSVVEQLKGNPQITLLTPKVTGTDLSFFVDCSAPPFDNKVARQALMYATDKKSIVELAYFGLGVVSETNSMLVPNHWAFDPNLPKRPYDIQKAKELFKEAGIKEGSTLKFDAIAGRQDVQTGAEILQRSLKECGITLDIRAVDLAQWASVIATGKHYPGWVAFNGSVRGWDPALQFQALSCNDPESNIWYCNPAVDALLAQGVAVLDREQRKQIYYKVQEILYEDVPWITYMHYFPYHAAWNYIKGLYVDGREMLHFDGVWTEK